MKNLITAFIVSAFLLPAASAQESVLGFVSQVVGEGSSLSHQIRNVDLSTTVRGTFGSARKHVREADWKQYAIQTKNDIIAKLDSDGWSIVVDMKTEPTGRLEYQIMLRATKGAETRQIEVVIFPSQDGITDIAFHEQLSTGLLNR